MNESVVSFVARAWSPLQNTYAWPVDGDEDERRAALVGDQRVALAAPHDVERLRLFLVDELSL